MTIRISSLIGALLPFPAVFVGLFLFRNGYIAIALYHAFMVLHELFFSRGKTDLRQSKTTTIPIKKILPLSLVVLAGPTLYIYIIFFNSFFESSILGAIHIRPYLQHYRVANSFVIFAGYFGLLHPIIEERHWRRICSSVQNIRHPRIYSFLLHLCFASYHIVVLYPLMSWALLSAVFLVLMGISYYWQYLYNNGAPLSLLITSHILADTSMIIALLFVLY